MTGLLPKAAPPQIRSRQSNTGLSGRTPGARQNANEGFTLIEIMVALAILGTALFVLLEAHYGALRLFTDARDQVEVNSLMERAMGVAEGEVMAGSVNGHGEFGKRFPDYSYSYQVEDIGGTQQPGFLSVTVVLQGPTESREMTLLMYKA